MSVPVLTAVAEVRAAVAAARRAGRRVGLVPTMGALHAGHAELVRVAARHTEFVVVSVFVNPTQFGPAEDYTRYPRTLDADVQAVAAAGGHVVFAPGVGEMYPERSVSFVEVTELDQHLEGPSRPGHFRGVCTVVLKLFHILGPDVAVFGQKDAQQARIVRQMVRDLNVPVELVIAPTVREPDGLAMSSRNRYLSPAERAVAPGIYKALVAARDRVRAGTADSAAVEAQVSAALSALPGSHVDYARVVADDSFAPLPVIDRPALLAVAVRLGTTRLIDNIELP